MNPLTREQVRAVDRYAINVLGIPGVVLMENAGRGCVEFLVQQSEPQRAVILCGAGNNAGDGFVIARHLLIHGWNVLCVTATQGDKYPDDARINYDSARKLNGIQWTDATSVPQNDWLQLLPELATTDWIVDALLGTGARGLLRPPFAELVAWANWQPSKKLAIDIPTGVDCNTGQIGENAFQATATCTFVASKPGLHLKPGQDFVGQLQVVDIGIPPYEVEEAIQQFGAQSE